MAILTSKGQELMQTISGSFDQGDWGWFETAGDCSLICRLATTYCRIQEEQCNGPAGHSANPHFDYEGWQRIVEKKESQIEHRIRKLCEQLPTVKGKRITPAFQGDPRGATVKLVMPDGRTDDWGQTGICVPGS